MGIICMCIIVSSVYYNSVCTISLILQDYRGTYGLKHYPLNEYRITIIIILGTNNYCKHGDVLESYCTL